MSRSLRARLDSRWDSTSYGRMHARVGGPVDATGAPVVVLVHGFVISSRYMVPTAERLAPYLRVLAPDLPGFGRSRGPRAVLRVPGLADALGEWLDVCGLQRVLLIGNSLGCQVIAHLAARRPHNVVGTVLSGPTIDIEARSTWKQLARALADVPREKLSLMPHWAGDFLRAGVRRSWLTLRHALDDRIEDSLPRMPMPTLVVRGSRDPFVSQRWTEHVTSLLPHGAMRVIDGGPHAVNYSSADEFARIVREFVAEIDATGMASPPR